MSSIYQTEAIVIGASAGGISALQDILTGLPADYGLPIIVLLHLPENRESKLAELFAHFIAMPVREAQDKDQINAGTLYFATAGYHLSVEVDRSFSLSCEAPVFFSRPSIDVLMESAAHAYGKHLVGILLTGANQDGADGLASIARHGGLTIVQDPGEAQVATMPKAAIAQMQPDMILPSHEIHQLLLILKTTV
ncbi:chemotaxis protein CheB [Undibacterium sp. TJN19]|uniref:chemotaxis protein CheB n=1 Tax=Undibacterium sp. TJN19 TaxID=3413055 RepID=UPI003BF44EBE